MSALPTFPLNPGESDWGWECPRWWGSPEALKQATTIAHSRGFDPGLYVPYENWNLCEPLDYEAVNRAWREDQEAARQPPNRLAVWPSSVPPSALVSHARVRRRRSA